VQPKLVVLASGLQTPTLLKQGKYPCWSTLFVTNLYLFSDRAGSFPALQIRLCLKGNAVLLNRNHHTQLVTREHRGLEFGATFQTTTCMHAYMRLYRAVQHAMDESKDVMHVGGAQAMVRQLLSFVIQGIGIVGCQT
jgi:hypothetical protein